MELLFLTNLSAAHLLHILKGGVSHAKYRLTPVPSINANCDSEMQVSIV